MITYDDVIRNLIATYVRENDGKKYIYYKNFEIDTSYFPNKPIEDITGELKEQIYEAEGIDFPKVSKGEIDIILNRTEGIKSCITTNRKHINETAATMTEKALLLEKLSYNIETKIDALIQELETMADKDV